MNESLGDVSEVEEGCDVCDVLVRGEGLIKGGGYRGEESTVELSMERRSCGWI